MNEDEFLPYALSRYEQEYQRHQNLDSKAFNVIGFVGIMVSIFSFIVGGKIPTNHFLVINIIGIGFLFLSMIVTIVIVFPRKTIPAINSKKYYEKLSKKESVANLTKAYVQLTTRFVWRNDRKAKKLKCSIIIMLIGLAFSFLGTILSL
ncbi:MAG: hypothetical protein D4R72_05970 [Nitrosopumilales archaeon]|nr:MAG: hypothetical protein D4R72_05970 [Nitrosopumilales archaeon]